MILIADSGSTKCDWVVVDKKRDIILKVKTEGINLRYLNLKKISEILYSIKELFNIKENITDILFYGAGFSDNQSQLNLLKIFSDYFPNAKVKIEEDLTAAVLASTSLPGVICILGTGSNSCYFDGTKIERRLASMGFLLMDDGSGNYFGKELLRSYYYNKMPLEIKEKFSKVFNLNEEIVLEHLYEKENVSGYLAQFARFIIENESDPFIKGIISKGVYNVFENLIDPYHYELKSVPLHFVGSIAHYLQQDILIEAKKRGYIVKSFVKAPMDNLVAKLKVNSMNL